MAGTATQRFLLLSALSLNCPVLAENKVYSLPLFSLSQIYKECAFGGVHLGPLSLASALLKRQTQGATEDLC